MPRPTFLLPLLLALPTAHAQAAAIPDDHLQACGGAPGFPKGDIKEGIYSGTVGKQTVYLKLSKQEQESVAFYDSQGIDIPLDVFQNGYSLILQETGRPSGQIYLAATGCYQLYADGPNLSGEWRTPDGKRRYDLTLRPLDVTKLPLRQLDTPTLRKLRHSDALTFIKVNRPWPQVKGGVKEPLTGNIYPRLPESLTTPANLFLHERQLGYVLDDLQCRAEASGNGSIDTTGNISFTSKHLLSLSDYQEYYCGGAHPDEGVVFDIYDRQTLKKVRVQDIWPALNAKKLQALYVEAALKDGLDPECKDELDSVSEVQTALGRSGLHLNTNDLPHVAAVCRADVTVNYAKLRQWADPKGRYFHDIYK